MRRRRARRRRTLRRPKARPVSTRDRAAIVTLSDPETDVAPGETRGRNMRSRCQCSMCPAIHVNSRSWLRSSSTHEPSDPPLRVVLKRYRVSVRPGQAGPTVDRGETLSRHAVQLMRHMRRGTGSSVDGAGAVCRGASLKLARREQLPVTAPRRAAGHAQLPRGLDDKYRYRILAVGAHCASDRPTLKLSNVVCETDERCRFDNDPSAGSPTETLLRLLLPLDDQV